jgi:hypothetical protein
VKHALTDALARDIETYALRFGCERCAHADLDGRVRCSLEYPNEEHREALVAARKVLVFCKEFELG